MSGKSIDWEIKDSFAVQDREAAPGASTERAVEEWENPLMTGRGRMAPHSPNRLYRTMEAAMEGGPFGWCQSLNGTWQFHIAPIPQAIPESFEQTQFDASSWHPIDVPGHWELQGFGQPIYTNIAYPFPPTPPFVPADANPTGCYRLEFEPPRDWTGKDVFIVFEGVDSAFELFLNEQSLGFSMGSRMPAEFNITRHLVPGRNLLAAKVYRWSAGTYLEDQDQWWLSGIFREVYLHALPQTHLHDLSTTPRINWRDDSADIDIRVELSRDPVANQPLKLNLQLLDPAGEPVATSKMDIAAESVAACLHVESPRLWSAESPSLYTLLAWLTDAQGNPQGFLRQDIGIREVRIQQGQLLINRRPVKLRGVNRHESNPRTGRFVTEEDMLRDILLIKQHNFNAVRLSHYPNHPRWYELCDEYGLYLIDEADLETHGVQDQLSKDPLWEKAYLDRMDRMVMRDRNHACIVAWSMGNESGMGVNFDKCAARIRELDPSGRPINYYHAESHPCVDWVGLHYVRLDQIRAALAQPDIAGRPILLEEYAHTMGNSLGNFREYWELIDSEPRLLGGFIWEWCDHGLIRTDELGREVYSYGGDFGDRPNDGTFCIDGLVFPDRALKPAMSEVKRVFQPAAMALQPDHANLLVANKRFHTSLDDLRLHWSLTVDGQTIGQGECELPAIEPQESGCVTLPPEALATAPGLERILTISLVLRASSAWAENGFELAWEQFVLPSEPAKISPPSPAPPLVLTDSEDLIEITTANMRARQLCSAGDLTVPGILLRGPQLNVFRAYLDNDDMFRKQWDTIGLPDLQRRVTGCKLLGSNSERVSILTETILDNADGQALVAEKLQTTILDSGWLLLEQTIIPMAELPTLPRLGMVMHLPPDMDSVQWYGKGPMETFCDRNTGAKLGCYSSSLEDLTVPYIHPQETGLRTDTRWLTICDSSGQGWFIAGEPTLQFTARRNTSADLHRARHQEDLKPQEFIELALDYRQAGTGNTSLRAERLPQYCVELKQPVTWRCAMKPVTGNDTDPTSLWHQLQGI